LPLFLGGFLVAVMFNNKMETPIPEQKRAVFIGSVEKSKRNPLRQVLLNAGWGVKCVEAPKEVQGKRATMFFFDEMAPMPDNDL
jgi:hypothetical protein